MTRRPACRVPTHLLRAEKNRSPELLRLAERAFALRTRRQGCSHPDTARSEELLAVVLRGRGEARAASLLHEEALAVREHLLGPDHLEVATGAGGECLVTSHDSATEPVRFRADQRFSTLAGLRCRLAVCGSRRSRTRPAVRRRP